MKKSTKIILTILTIIIIISSAVVLWQYDNISAVLNGLTKSSEDIASEINRKREDLKVKVEKYTNSSINDLTAEDEQKLLKGEMSLDEIAKKYDLPIEYINDENNEQEDFSPTKDVSESQQSNFGKSSDDVTVDNSKIIEKEIGDSVSRMYALKAKYVNKLGELEREVIDQYSKLPEIKQNKEGKKELVMANVDYVAKLEKTCDSEVDKVISALEKNLKELGGDIQIIQILKDAYTDEKELKKSYYLSLYNE
jgi:hypothetical protein